MTVTHGFKIIVHAELFPLRSWQQEVMMSYDMVTVWICHLGFMDCLETSGKCQI